MVCVLQDLWTPGGNGSLSPGAASARGLWDLINEGNLTVKFHRWGHSLIIINCKPQLFYFITNDNCELSVSINIRPHFMFSLCFLPKGVLVIFFPANVPLCISGLKINTLLPLRSNPWPCRCCLFVRRCVFTGWCLEHHKSCWHVCFSHSFWPQPMCSAVFSAFQLLLLLESFC